jgi:hypothetical protein
MADAPFVTCRQLEWGSLTLDKLGPLLREAEQVDARLIPLDKDLISSMMQVGALPRSHNPGLSPVTVPRQHLVTRTAS